MGKGLLFSSKSILLVLLLPAFASAALAYKHQQIIAHKEQKQASQRAEYNLQHGIVSQSMAKSAAVRPLGGFCFD